MAPYDSDSDSEDVDLADEGHFELDDDHNVLRRSRQPLGLTRNYVPGWKPGHAIREFYQNWKDAIVETAQLQQKDFEPLVKGFDKKGVYIVEARHPATGKLLGFIRFKDGVLEFTNFGAQLTRRALDIGETSKRDNREAAGTHGEGFKIGSLVMVRRGYRVQYEASKFRWTMKFGGKDESMLYCFLSDMKDTTLKKRMEVYEKNRAKGKPRELKNNIWEDVTVRIGIIRGHGRKIEIEDFRKWIDVSIDLNRPSEMIQTTHGSLILDPKYCNKVYLKGLLLEGKSSEKQFKFGYNLVEGKVNRDRERLTDPVEEARVLAEIWAEAIRFRKESTVKEWVAMLREDKFADVHGVAPYISEDAAQKIWQHLLEMDVEGECFYHDSRNGDTDVELIRNSLKKKPEQLTSLAWNPLRKYGLVRTPREQQCHLLNKAPLTQICTTPYSLGVERALKAALALDTRTKDLNLIFKSGIKTDLDLLLDGSELQINDKWLHFKNSHQLAPCRLSRQAYREYSDADHFSCDHIVTDLYELVLNELKRRPQIDLAESSESDSSLYQRVCDSLHQMPIMIMSKAGTFSKTIDVSWTDSEGDVLSRLYGLDPKCRITLHRESQAEHQLLVGSNAPCSDGYSSCGCPEKVVSRKDSSATFCGLNLDEAYFPMVSRNDSQAFFGLSPKSLKPERVPVPVSKSRATSIYATPRRSPARNSVTPKEDFTISDMGDLYGVSDDDDDEEEPPMNDLPDHSPMPRPSNRSLTSGRGLSSNLSHRSVTPLITSPMLSSASRAAHETEQLRAQNKSLEANVEEKDQLLSTLRADMHLQSTQLAAKEQEVEALRLQLEWQKTALASQEQQKGGMEEEILQKQQQLEAKEQLIQQIRESFEASERKCAELENDLSEIREVNNDLEEQLRTKSKELGQANSENENYEGQLEDATQECLAKIRQIDEATANVERLTQDLQIANETLQDQRKEIDDLNAKIESLKGSEVAGGEPAGSSPSKVWRLEAANNQLRTQRRTLKNNITDLERRLREAEEAYDTQIRLAAETVQRQDRRLSLIRPKIEQDDSSTPLRPKRERGGDEEEVGTPTPSSRSPKRSCTGVNATEEDAIDLTDD